VPGHAVQDPASGIPQKIQSLHIKLGPAHAQAIDFLDNQRNKSATKISRLTQISNLPAKGVVEELADELSDLIQASHQTALRACTTKTMPQNNGKHFRQRPISKKRQKLTRKLYTIRQIKSHLTCPAISSAKSMEDMLAHNKPNKPLCDAIYHFKEFREGTAVGQPPSVQLKSMEESIKAKLHIMDKAHHKECTKQARKQQQRLISKRPKQAHKQTFASSSGQPRAGLRALQDPATKFVETEHDKLETIIHDFYKDSLKAAYPKTGTYLPEDAPRNYPWDQRNRDTPDPFTLETHITRGEKEQKSERSWLHTSITDRAAFHECIKSLGNNKSPGPDNVVNETLKMQPSEIKEAIHNLFIIMWATGVTPTAWKTSETILLDKNKGDETLISSYRPVGLANTLYKLWTRMVTNTLYEYAESHSLLSSTQAGFRKQKDTILQLQNVIMALEDAKAFQKDIYALIVDFTSAFNTTDHDRMLMIMYDLGFPTDAIETVKNLYEGANTQIRLPFGGSTCPIPVERGTIQGDTLSPFLFLIYMEPLLRWLHVGGRGYNHACLESQNNAGNLTSLKLKHLNNNLSNGAFADDLICLTNTLSNLHVQADKLTRYSDWAALQVSGSKTKVTGILHCAAHTGLYGQDPSKQVKKQLAGKINGQHAQFIKQDEPFLYLGVELNMNLNWEHQHKLMSENSAKTVEWSQGLVRFPPANSWHYKHSDHTEPRLCISRSAL